MQESEGARGAHIVKSGLEGTLVVRVTVTGPPEGLIKPEIPRVVVKLEGRLLCGGLVLNLKQRCPDILEGRSCMHQSVSHRLPCKAVALML